MASQCKKDLIEIYPDVFVPRKEVESHGQRMSQEIEAKNHSDVMSPTEEEEWEISKRIRESVKHIAP
jgi:hypothetical protein